MAIITKPVGGILKGVPATITLNKSELLALASVSADSYFSVTTNWNKIILSYKSSEGKQQEIVEFNATLSSPTGFFDVSLKARDLFEIQVIKIIDFDGDIFIIPRSELTTSDFDVEFQEAPSNLSYTTPVTYTQNQEITNNVPTVTGTVTSYSISPALPAGLNFNTTTGVISGTPTEVSTAANYTVTASNSGGSTTANISITVEAASSTGNYITYETLGTGITTDAFGGIQTSQSSNQLAFDTDVLTGDFDIEFNFNPYFGGNDSFVGVKDTLNNDNNYKGFLISGSNVGTYFGAAFQEQLGTIVGKTKYRVKRTGTTISFYVNDVKTSIDLLNTPQPLYVTVRANIGIGLESTVNLLEVPVGDPIIWDTFLNGAIAEADGGISGGIGTNMVKSDASKVLNGADFKVTYNFTMVSAGGHSNLVHGIMNSISDTGFAGLTGITYQSSTDILIYDNYSGSGSYQATFSNSMMNQNGSNTAIFEKVGSMLTIKMNGVTIYTKNTYTEQTVVPAVRTWSLQALDSATVELLEVPAEMSFSPSLIPSNISLSNNNRTAENTQAINYPSAPVVPSIMLNSGKKVYSEFTVENVAASTTIAFGAFFRTGEPSVSDLASTSVTLPGGTSPGSSRVVYQGGIIYVGSSPVVTFGVITSNMVVGLGIDLVANTAFVTKDGVKVGSDFVINPALIEADRAFFAVGPNQVGEKFTINETPVYTLPSGYEYIG